jgi:large subunit ribosomal protein L10
MKTRAEKTEELALLKETFSENPVLVLCSFKGLNVDADAELRGEIRKSGGGYRVINNRLARVAAEGESYQSAFTGLTGMTSLVYAKDDPVGLLKVLVEYSKKNPLFSCKAGLVEGQQYDADDLVKLSKMPSKVEVQAKLLYLLNAPAQQLMGVLKASARDIASVVQQGVEKEKFAG